MKNKREWFLEEHKDLPILIQIILEQFQMNALKILEAIYFVVLFFQVWPVLSFIQTVSFLVLEQMTGMSTLYCGLFPSNFHKQLHLLGDHPHKFNLNQFYFKPSYYLMRIRWHFINTILLDLVVPLLYKQLLFLVPMSGAGRGV